MQRVFGPLPPCTLCISTSPRPTASLNSFMRGLIRSARLPPSTISFRLLNISVVISTRPGGGKHFFSVRKSVSRWHCSCIKSDSDYFITNIPKGASTVVSKCHYKCRAGGRRFGLIAKNHLQGSTQ